MVPGFQIDAIPQRAGTYRESRPPFTLAHELSIPLI